MDSGNLAAVPLFAMLPKARLDEIAERYPSREVRPGVTVAECGASARHLLVVESGILSGAFNTRAGSTVRFATVTGPCTVDKAAVLDEAVHTARWTALTDCRIRLLPARILRDLIDEVPALRDHVLRHLSAQVNHDRRARVRAAAPRPVGRLADWIAESSRTHGSRVRLPGAQQGLGEEIGLSRITVNRALRALAEAGAIRIEPRVIVVLDAGRLAAAAAGTG